MRLFMKLKTYRRGHDRVDQGRIQCGDETSAFGGLIPAKRAEDTEETATT
jgi:hypothetical protein